MKTDELLAEILKKAIAVAEKTGDFVIEQSPLLLKEFYIWHIWSNVFSIIFGIILFIIGRYLPYVWLSKNRIDEYCDKFFSRYGDVGIGAAWFNFTCCSIVGLCMVLNNIYNLMFILVAPKLFLIEYFIK